MSSDSADKVDGALVDPDLADIVRLLRRACAVDVRVSVPARVIAFDPITCKATVRVEFLRIIDVRGEEVPDIPTLLSNVPVRFDRSAIAGTTYPITTGTTGRVVFSDRALAAWLQNGNPVAPVDPESGRMHNLADAIFECGVMTDADAIAAGPIDMTGLVVDGPLVKLGAAAAQPVILGTAFLAALSSFLTAVAGESMIHPNTATAATTLNGLITAGALVSTKVLME